MKPVGSIDARMAYTARYSALTYSFLTATGTEAVSKKTA